VRTVAVWLEERVFVADAHRKFTIERAADTDR
jgi:hypothetical protein